MTTVGAAEPPAFIHPTATVEAGARISPGARVWHHAHVRTGAVVGQGTQLGRNVFVDAEVVLGAGIKIQNNVSIYRGVVLEDLVFVGPSAVFTNDLVPRAFGEWSQASTLVRRGASIGAGAVVLPVEVGSFAMVGAGAVVTRNVESHQLVVGNPARGAGWVCRCGTIVDRSTGPAVARWCGGCEYEAAEP